MSDYKVKKTIGIHMPHDIMYFTICPQIFLVSCRKINFYRKVGFQNVTVLEYNL